MSHRCCSNTFVSLSLPLSLCACACMCVFVVYFLIHYNGFDFVICVSTIPLCVCVCLRKSFAVCVIFDGGYFYLNSDHISCTSQLLSNSSHLK